MPRLHSQSALEGILELKLEHGFQGEDVERIEIDIFDVAYKIIGGGEEGDKTIVHTKEQADHSLPYMVAVALLDGEVMPEQYRPERISRQDVQDLLKRVIVRPSDELSQRFPAEMPCRLTLYLRDGRVLLKEKTDYEGFQDPSHELAHGGPEVRALGPGSCRPRPPPRDRGGDREPGWDQGERTDEAAGARGAAQ